jgi:hypothetical protein
VVPVPDAKMGGGRGRFGSKSTRPAPSALPPKA